MRPSAKTAALACAAALLIGASAAASQGSAGTAPVPAPSDGPTAVTFMAGQRGDVFSSGAVWRLHVKPGLYHASLRATMFIQPDDPNATEASAICGVVDFGTLGQFTRIYFADSTVQLFNGPPAAMSGSAVVRVTPDVKPAVVCFVGAASLQLYQPVSVTFTTLGKRTYGEATPKPIPFKKRLGRVFGMH